MHKYCIVLVLFCISTYFQTCHGIDKDKELYYNTESFEVLLDHFSFVHNDKFHIKYLLNATFWDKANHGPIFVYTGNDAGIETFAENSGFMWNIAKEFGAALIFMEHRFYGVSSPPDTLKQKFETANLSIMGFLTVEQALADYALLITQFKYDNDADSSPVIAFGGSYGGVLTAWLRMKYPHIVAGGIASSAPFYLQTIPCESFELTEEYVFSLSNKNCAAAVKKSWDYLNRLDTTTEGRKWISKTWRLCDPIEKDEDIPRLKTWLDNMYDFLAMANYPYPANFLQNLPANPVNEFCKHLKYTDLSSGNQLKLLEDMFNSINVYINNSGTAKCFDYSDTSRYSVSYSASDENSLNYQGCTELIDPECDDGTHGFYENEKWNFTEFSEQCYETYKIRPQLNRTDLFFGGKNIISASNIVFSNGILDPWFAYGVLGNLSDSLVSIIIPEAAHHLDLRGANPTDPLGVVEAREFEKSQIRKWILQFHKDQQKVNEAFID